MFIAHLPAGYIATKAILKYFPTNLIRKQYVYLLGLFSSILPDLDMLYFYLIDNRKHLHHEYWTHIPLFWLCIFFTMFIFSILFQKIKLMYYITVILINVFIHLFLDTVAGKIKWLYPYSNQDFVFSYVPSAYTWWILNFALHWTFLFEIAFVIWGLYVYLNSSDLAK